LNMVLFGVLGALALVVASVGVYGVVQYAVVERWHELGIRAALGASMHQLTRLIVAEGAILGVAGISAGVLAALSLTRVMTAILFGVAPADATTFVSVAALLLALAMTASYLPARLAGRADPSVLLRSRSGRAGPDNAAPTTDEAGHVSCKAATGSTRAARSAGTR
jgi:ABC-type antimicrobial peptide transport system permease subunit